MKPRQIKGRKELLLVYALAVLLMFVRIDYWWWGKSMPMILFDWINLPMLYQFFIWAVGYLLVIFTANRIWVDDD
jgi:hypothetical protein